MRHCIQHSLDHRVGKLRETVMDPKPIFSRFDQSRPPQVSKVARGLRLRYAEALVDIADAHLARHQETDEAEAGAVRQRLENDFQREQLFLQSHYAFEYIRLGKYISR